MIILIIGKVLTMVNDPFEYTVDVVIFSNSVIISRKKS
jgi:hypothetical protein